MTQMKNYIPWLVALLVACSTPQQEAGQKNLRLTYEVVGIDFDSEVSTVRIQVINETGESVSAPDWAIYWSQFAVGPVQAEVAGLKLERVTGDYWKLQPTGNSELPDGGSIGTDWPQQGLMLNDYQLPVGVYLVANGEVQALEVEVKPIDPSLIPGEYRPTPGSRWEENAIIQDRSATQVNDIFPTPVRYERGNGTLSLKSITYCAPEELGATAAQFGEWLQSEAGLTSFQAGTDCNLRLSIDGSLGQEGYSLSISEEGVDVSGGSPAGVFYGLMSVLSAASIDDLSSKNGALTLPYLEVEDEPAFGYRGMHLDVSRNFQKPEVVKKLLRMMAFYKLNKFHFHLTDDEGWRFEVPALPELTAVGARRGHTEDEMTHILPAYGSGPDPDSPDNHGSGFYSSEELIDILQYAQSLNIEVIPEVDLPGHARAAIKAMESRLASSGDATYRLAEPGDTSKYISAQIYSDNVINVCQESTYDFVELVADHLIDLYSEAGVPLNTLHIGCDEVPHGAWAYSPGCQDLIAQGEGRNPSEYLLQYFVSRVSQMLKTKGLRTAGWEEVIGDPSGADQSLIPYIWHNEELAYGLANRGYEVVLCNAANLYFDLAYNPDPAEPGLKWAGFVDTKSAFTLSPYHIGQSLNPDAVSVDQSILTTTGKRNILGIQGELWSETVRGGEVLEYYIMPKMFGLVERAWTGDPEWESEADRNADWSDFVHQVGNRELPRLNALLGGWNYRVPLPGLNVENDLVSANVRFPGLPIHYTTDGSDPTSDSPRYDEPIPYDANLRFRVIVDEQHQSRVVMP